MGRPCYQLIVEREMRQEIERRFRQTKDVRERERLEVLRLACTGQYTLTEMAEETGRSRSVIYTWLTKFKREGLDAMLKRGKPGASASPLHDEKIMTELRAELAAGNFRTAKQLMRWLQKKHGVQLTLWGSYYWLRKCRAKLKVPRPVHLKKKPLAAENFPAQLEVKLRECPLEAGRPVRIWMQDEGRFGLHTIVRRCWGLPGVRVVKTNQKKYQWGYVYGALEIGTGKAEMLIMPGVDLGISEVFLKHLAESEPEAEHIVIWDGAGFHQKAGKHALPDRVHVIEVTGVHAGTQSDRKALGRDQGRYLQPPFPHHGRALGSRLRGTQTVLRTRAGFPASWQQRSAGLRKSFLQSVKSK